MAHSAAVVITENYSMWFWMGRRRACLELGDFGEVEGRNLERWNDHRGGLLTRCALRSDDHLDAVQYGYQTFVETEFADSVPDLAVFDVERSIPRHTRENLLIGIHFTDVPKAGNQHSSRGCRDHFIYGMRIARKNDISRKFA